MPNIKQVITADAVTPALVLANADTGKAMGAATAAAPKKADKLSGGDDPDGVKGRVAK